MLVHVRRFVGLLSFDLNHIPDLPYFGRIPVPAGTSGEISNTIDQPQAKTELGKRQLVYTLWNLRNLSRVTVATCPE